MHYKLTLQNHVDGITSRTWAFTTPAVLGRDPTATICIDHDSISRKHCQFTTNIEEALVIRDLGSLNGTYVDDIRIQHETLMPGQVIQIGALRLQIAFSTEDEVQRKPTPKATGSVTETKAMPTMKAPVAAKPKGLLQSLIEIFRS
jgi:pSer/pThr/pTyr-binding forkhead associated (FHA) protein